MKLFGVVILYNPDDEVIDNIQTYLKYVDELFVLDNSEKIKLSVINRIKELNKIKYISFNENMGISYALIFVLNQLDDDTFLLTMDQDSKFDNNMLSQYIKLIEDYELNNDNIAMYSVNWESENNKPDITHEIDAITSGSIVNVKTAKFIGGFDENLFIDEVDTEFCFRAQNFNFKIIRFNRILLNHHLGDPTVHQFLWKHPIASNHSGIRKYYIIRNSIYIYKHYHNLRSRYFKYIVKTIIKTLLFEENKREKTKYMLKGLLDGMRNKWGKYS